MSLFPEASVQGLNPQHWVCATASVPWTCYMLHMDRLYLLLHDTLPHFHGSGDHTLTSSRQYKRLKKLRQSQGGL